MLQAQRANILWVMLLAAWLGPTSGPARAGDDLAVQYLQRLSQTDRNDAVALASLGDWASANDLSQEAAEVYRRVLEIRPDDNEVYQRLVRIADTTRLPEDPKRQQALQQQFGKKYQLHVSPHFLIFYDTDPAWALNRAVLLEKTHDIFYSAFRRADLKPLPLSERLVCLLFDSHDDFADYARRVDRMNMSWSSGYYSVRTNRIAFFNDKTNPAHQRVVDHIAELEKTIDALRQNIRRDSRNPALVSVHRQKLEAAMREHQWYRNRLRGVAGMANTAKTTHEAVHQLAFNSNLQVRNVFYPFWLAEGLATNFETDDPAANFGPYFDNVERRKLLTDMQGDDKLMKLDKFVTMTTLPVNDAQRVSELYAQAYGLFQFLFKKRHDQMRKYLEKLSKIPPGNRQVNALRAEFIDAFGPIDTVEDQFTTWIRLMR